MPRFGSKHFHLSWILAAVLTAVAIFYIEKKYQTPPHLPPLESNVKSGTLSTSSPSQTETTSPTPSTVPTQGASQKTYNLKVPFTPQAPTANWDELHNEACEEASMIMAHAYFSGMTDVTLKPEFVEAEITKLTEWEKQQFGYYLDINAAETARTLEEVYSLKTKVLNGYTEDRLKEELLQNHLVLILANGRLLGNPNFRQPGPPYHMFVLRGWNTQGFVTNDPGTRKGMNYIYTYQTIYNAGGDWSHEINAVDQGTKAAVVVWKE